MLKIYLKINGRVISKKNSRRIFAKHGRIINIPSGAYARYKDSALNQLAEQITNTIQPPYKIDYLFEMKGAISNDFDNMITSINDILQDANIIENDKYIRKGTYEVTTGNKEFTTYIDIESLDNLINYEQI
jgi:Holliday junction resolvase RusA-like endonuclease